MAWLPVNAPPAALDVVAVHDVALAEVHVTESPSPKLILAAAAGCEKLTVGAGVVGAGVLEPYPPPPLSPPHAVSTLTSSPAAAFPHVETRIILHFLLSSARL
jgi:hypothetical protein